MRLAILLAIGAGAAPPTGAGLAAQGATPASLIERAARAMGGPGALDGLRNKVVGFHTVTFGLGQEETALSPPRATVLVGRTVTDFAGARQLTTQEVRLVSGVVNRERRVTLGTMSLLERNGALQMEPAAVPAGLERALSLMVERVMLAAVHHGSAAASLRPKTIRGEVVDGVRMALGPDTVALWFDRTTGLPIAAETLTDDDITGDRRTITWYTRWQPAGAILLPRQVDVEVNGRLLSHTVITAAATNQTADETAFAIPDSMAARAPRGPGGPAPIAVTLTELGSGIWRAEGGSHHSVIVEQGGGLLVIEAPQSRARSSAVLDTLRSRFPGRAVTGVVMTHHHHDHSGGVRAYQARGIRVIGHHRQAGFVRSIATARKTVAPDRLSRGGAVPPFTAVRDSLVLGPGSTRVVLYPLPTVHAEGLLVAWIPEAGILFTSDVLSPLANQPPARAGSQELVAFTNGKGIRPTRFAGGHGVVADWTAVEAAAR